MAERVRRWRVTQTAVLLSGSIGKGHDAVAQACAACLSERDITSEILDCMALLGGARARVAQRSFRSLLGVPPLYDALHFSVLRSGSPLASRAAQRATRRLAPVVLDRVGTADLAMVIAVFATGAGVAAEVRRRRRVPAFVVVPDATAHRLWVHEGIDRYLVFSEIAAGSVRQYDPRADVVILDPPVRPEFRKAPAREEARRALGHEGARPIVLMMGGAWGRGPLAEAAGHLHARGVEVVVLAGTNRRLVRRARGSGNGLSSPRYLEFTDDVPLLMAAADVVVTSAGQACHEARAVGRSLVVVDSVPGHGRENVLAELARGQALATPARAEAIEAAVLAMLERDPPSLSHEPRDWAAQFHAAITLPD